MQDHAEDTTAWIEGQLRTDDVIECELGSLVAAASAWTEDETELDDLVGGLVEAGQVSLAPLVPLALG